MARRLRYSLVSRALILSTTGCTLAMSAVGAWLQTQDADELTKAVWVGSAVIAAPAMVLASVACRRRWAEGSRWIAGLGVAAVVVPLVAFSMSNTYHTRQAVRVDAVATVTETESFEADQRAAVAAAEARVETLRRAALTLEAGVEAARARVDEEAARGGCGAVCEERVAEYETVNEQWRDRLEKLDDAETALAAMRSTRIVREVDRSAKTIAEIPDWLVPYLDGLWMYVIEAMAIGLPWILAEPAGRRRGWLIRQVFKAREEAREHAARRRDAARELAQYKSDFAERLAAATAEKEHDLMVLEKDLDLDREALRDQEATVLERVTADVEKRNRELAAKNARERKKGVEAGVQFRRQAQIRQSMEKAAAERAELPEPLNGVDHDVDAAVAKLAAKPQQARRIA